MTLDQLRYALELQRTRNFSRAAEACHITQPSLSVQIAKLEEELGIVLFDRGRAGVEVTDYGRELLKQARVILDETARLGELASELKSEIRGEFRLGVIPTLAPTLLPLFLGGFTRLYPRVRLSIIEERTEKLVQDLDHGRIDGALLSTPARCPDSIVEKVLFYEPFVVFASDDHPILNEKTVGFDKISADEVLLLDETHCLRDQVIQICRSKQKPRDNPVRLQSAGLQTLIEYIRRGREFTLLPALAADRLTAKERKSNVRHFEKPVPSRKVSLVFHRARLKRALIDALAKAVLEHVPGSVILTNRDVRVLSPGSQHFEL